MSTNDVPPIIAPPSPPAVPPSHWVRNTTIAVATSLVLMVGLFWVATWPDRRMRRAGDQFEAGLRAGLLPAEVFARAETDPPPACWAQCANPVRGKYWVYISRERDTPSGRYSIRCAEGTTVIFEQNSELFTAMAERKGEFVDLQELCFFYRGFVNRRLYTLTIGPDGRVGSIQSKRGNL